MEKWVEHFLKPVSIVAKTMALLLQKLQKVLEVDLFLNVYFDGDLSLSKAQSFFPSTLKHLMEMILENGSLKSNASRKTNKVAENISQLIKFNALKHK